MEKELYFSLDIESDGPIPGPHSMLSFGLVPFDLDTQVEKPFEANLELLPGAEPDKSTMEFWNANRAAYDATRVNTIDPEDAMKKACAWIRLLCDKHKSKPVCIAYPATFDFLFWHWYAIRFGCIDPFGFQAFDMKTAAAIILDIPFRQSTKRNFPNEWFKGAPKHDHTAAVDAIGQGVMFTKMMTKWRR